MKGLYVEQELAVKWEVADTLKSVVIQCIGFSHGASLYDDYRRKEKYKNGKRKNQNSFKVL